MGYSAKAVANCLLSKFGRHGISPLKLQKLVYLAHGWHLALFDEPLIEDEYAEAWQYGPVFPSLYHEFKHRGRLPIINPATEAEVTKPGNFDVEYTTPNVPRSDKRTRKMLNRIWEVYGKFSDTQLSAISHRQGSPWETTRIADPVRNNANIDDRVIKEYYRRRLDENAANQQ